MNAGKAPVTALPGSSYFDSADSFAMIRGGHIDVAIMGGLQVDQSGNLANWAIPGKPLLGVGGAMDLASGARRLIITMTHCNRDGSPKIVPECSLPLTAVGAVDLLITELAVFAFDAGEMRLVELMPGRCAGRSESEDGSRLQRLTRPRLFHDVGRGVGLGHFAPLRHQAPALRAGQPATNCDIVNLDDRHNLFCAGCDDDFVGVVVFVQAQIPQFAAPSAFKQF